LPPPAAPKKWHLVRVGGLDGGFLFIKDAKRVFGSLITIFLTGLT